MHRRPLLTAAAYAYLFAMLGLLFLPLVVRAQALPSSGFPYAQAGNTYTFSGGTTTSANASSLSFGNPANGSVYAEASQSLPIGGGQTATVNPRSVPSAGNVAKALKNFASKIVAPLVIGVAIYDLAKELGFNLDNNGGTVVVTKPDASVCTVAPCYQFSVWPENLGWSNTPMESCLKYMVHAGATAVTLANTSWCSYDSYVHVQQQYRTVSPASSASAPSSMSEFEQAIAAQSGWPSGSHIGRALGDAVASGEPLPLPAPSSVTGPASVPGVPTVTNFPDGSRTTVTPEKSISYGPGSVTVTDKTTTTHTSPSGVTTPVQDSTAPAPLPAPAQEVSIETCGLPGKPACKIDEAGTPSPLPGTQYDAVLDPFKQSVDDKRAVIGGTGDKSFFGGWSLFFFAPPVVQCEPLAMPTYLGVQIDALDPCPVADGMRTVMGYIWALVALYLCLRMIREVA